MDMKQMMSGAQVQPEANGMGMDAKMMDMMTKMRAMMDEMIAMMQGEGRQSGFESVDKE